MKKIYTPDEISAQRKLDAERRETLWAALTEQLGGDESAEQITSAFKQLYTLYKPELAEWYANLYDPAVGGYYSTDSGRDYESFGPDLECTMQSMAFVRTSGLIEEVGPLEEAIPEDMQRAMVRFAKSCQSENGFFYHPHWNVADIDGSISRRGRDLGWAVQILSAFGSNPTYDTPNGRKGDGLDADGNPVAVKEKSVSNSAAEKPAAPARHAPYLENRETFLEYLSEFDLVNKSYHWGNMLNSTVGQIRARSRELVEGGADYSLVDILIDYLNERICPETGYWGREVNMAGSNGYFKILAVYNSLEKPYPACEKATESVLMSIMGDEIDAGNCCSLYNLWNCVSFIKSNVRKFASEEDKERILGRINKVLRERGAEAILNTYKKIKPYQKGVAFSHQYHGNGGAQQGLYTGMTGLFVADEGNVDATGICSTGLVRAMFETFGARRVPILYKADWMVYLNIINTAKPVVKKYPQEPYRKLDNKEALKFVPALANTEWELKDGAYEVKLLAEGHGFDVERTARVCKGDYVLLETELSITDIIEDGTLRIDIIRGRVPNTTTLIYLDLKVKGDELTVACDKWEHGFKKTIKLPDSIKLKIEYYIDPMERKDKKLGGCTAERVYINDELMGTAVNNDGTDPKYQTGTPLHINGTPRFYTPDSLRATLRVKDMYYSYPKL